MRRNARLFSLYAMALAFGCAPAWAQPEQREPGAHVHGSGRLAVVFEDGKLRIELDAPAADIVGFEHKPEGPEQLRAVEEATARLKEGMTLFQPSAAAACTLTSAEAELETGTEAKGLDDKPAAAAHIEFIAAYDMDCAEPDKLTSLEIGYFEAFPRAQTLDVLVVTSKGQSQVEVTRAKPQLDLAN